MPDTAQILLNIYDGARQPLSNEVKWFARLSDGRPLSERQTFTSAPLSGAAATFDVQAFNNFFDDYTVVVSPHGYDDSGWFPVRVHPNAPAVIDVLALPSSRTLNFANATWSRLQAERPNVATIIQRGCQDTPTAGNDYSAVLESRPKSLACFLNITTALSQMRLPSGKTPLDYYWNIAWPRGDLNTPVWIKKIDSVFKQDRFFCYVDAAILPDIRNAARSGAFAPEPNPGILHPDATESYKQTQFDVANVQLTFHGHDMPSFLQPDGSSLLCIKIEPDIDYYKDLLSHSLLEVIPNWLTKGLTEPAIAFALRWMAGQRAGMPSFDPLFTVEEAAGQVFAARRSSTSPF